MVKLFEFLTLCDLVKNYDWTEHYFYYDELLISEQIGVPKPDVAIFDHTLALLGNPDRSRVLMVGDTPESDILGGINAGVKTCWIDHGTRPLPEHIKPT